jgi:hypothetical protein
VTVNRVFPGTLSTRIRPPCAVAIASAMDSPSPVLPASCDRDASPRTKRSNNVASSSGGMPGPLSVTLSSTVPGSPPAASAIVTVVPAGVCLAALLTRLVITWYSRCSSPSTITGSLGSSSRHLWSAAVALASLAALIASRLMSTGSFASGRPASSRASSSSSSTSTLIRADSASTRRSACSMPAGSVAGWRTASSA